MSAVSPEPLQPRPESMQNAPLASVDSRPSPSSPHDVEPAAIANEQQPEEAGSLKAVDPIATVAIDTTSNVLTSAMIFARYPELSCSGPFPSVTIDFSDEDTNGSADDPSAEDCDAMELDDEHKETAPQPTAGRVETTNQLDLNSAKTAAGDDDDTADDSAVEEVQKHAAPSTAAAAHLDERQHELVEDSRESRKLEETDAGETDGDAEDEEQEDLNDEDDELLVEVGQSESEGEEVETEAQRLLSPMKGILSPLKIASIPIPGLPRSGSPRAVTSPHIGPTSPKLGLHDVFAPSPEAIALQIGPSASAACELQEEGSPCAADVEAAPEDGEEAALDDEAVDHGDGSKKRSTPPTSTNGGLNKLKVANPKKLKGELTGSYWDMPSSGRRGTRRGASPTGAHMLHWRNAELSAPEDELRLAQEQSAAVEAELARSVKRARSDGDRATAGDEKRPRMSLENLTDNMLFRALKSICSEPQPGGAAKQNGDAVDDARAKDLGSGYEDLAAWNGKWGRQDLQDIVNSVVDQYVVALNAAVEGEEPATYTEISDHELDALGAEPLQQQQIAPDSAAAVKRSLAEQQQRTVALTLAFAASKKLTRAQIQNFQKSEIDTPRVRGSAVPATGGKLHRCAKRPPRGVPATPSVRIMQCSQLGWVVKQLPANVPVPLQVPSWAQHHKPGADRRSSIHLQAVRAATVDGHFPADPKACHNPLGSPISSPTEGVPKEAVSELSEALTELLKRAPKTLAQDYELHRHFISSSVGRKVFRSCRQATEQHSPELTRCRERLQQLSRQCNSRDVPVAVKPVIGLLNELLRVTEARTETAWASVEMLCSKYTEEQDVSISAKRETFNRGLQQLCEVVSQSTPNLYDRNLAMESIELEEAVAEGKPSAQRVDRILRKWCFEHFSQPYPDKQEKEQLCVETKLTTKKLNDWLTNWRKRVINKR